MKSKKNSLQITKIWRPERLMDTRLIHLYPAVVLRHLVKNGYRRRILRHNFKRELWTYEGCIVPNSLFCYSLSAPPLNVLLLIKLSLASATCLAVFILLNTESCGHTKAV